MTQQTPPQVDANPRAAAKAAKAYAKASRPWYKKKRWIALIAIVVIAVIASVSGGDSDSGPEKVSGDSSSTKSEAGSNKAGTEGNPVKVGETVKLEGTEYTVKSAKSASEVGGEFLKETAGGIYVIVELTIENKKDETKTFMANAAEFVASNGKKYSTDDTGSFAVENPLILEDMQPDVPKTGTLVYDVPPNVVAGGVLKLEDLFGRGAAYIDLGLK